MNAAPTDDTEAGLAAMTPGLLHRATDLEPGSVLGRIATLEVRLAACESDVEAAQALRHRVFHGDGTGGGRDADRFDAICDHLLVIDTAGTGEAIVGTYRLLRQSVAERAGGFYTADEFQIDGLVARHPDLSFLELGRSCVLPAYRSRRSIELLWQGIWAYVRHYGIDVMTGCASFPGTVPAAHAQALSFLAHECTATGEWAVGAQPGRFSAMDLMPREAVQSRSALAGMPPLVKGYLRLGGRVGHGCVVDHAFGTTDVLIILPVSAICDRYISYYGADAQRFAA